LELLLGQKNRELDEKPSSKALHLAHPFPAPMSPLVARTIVNRTTRPGQKVLDPMVGSGTVVVVASVLGRTAYGLDIDPLSRLMVRVTVRNYDADKIWAATARVLSDALALTANSRQLDVLFERIFDTETKDFIRYWFPLRSRRSLLALWLGIQNINSVTTRNALALAFSRSIIAKTSGASLAIDLPHTRPHKRAYKKVVDPLQTFARRVDELLRRLNESRKENFSAIPSIRAGDARKLPYQSGSIDLVITSSPYANAIDYVRAHKFSLVWMGHSVTELAGLRAKMIGAERGERNIREDFKWLENWLPRPSPKVNRRRAILRHYFYDLDEVIQQIHRVLDDGGASVFIVGRSTIGRRAIDTPAILVRIAERRGFKHVGTKMRRINPMRRSLPFATSKRLASGLGKRMSEEAVIGFAKQEYSSKKR